MDMIPSLSFAGNAEEAMKFYEKALGGNIGGIMRYENAPGGNPYPEAEGKVLHGALHYPGGMLYFSDVFHQPVQVGNNLEFTLACESEEEVRRLFEGLAEGAASVAMEPQETFWGGFYAQFVDRYGVGWGLNFQKAPLEE